MKSAFCICAFAALFLAGCGSHRCSLSHLKIGDVTLTGNDAAYMSAAVETELFVRGAQYDPHGAQISGQVFSSSDGTPYAVTIRMEGAPYAGSGNVAERNNNASYRDFLRGASVERRLADVAVADLCRCVPRK